MSVIKIIWNIILGPLLLWLLLIGHVVYQTGFRDADEITINEWSKETKENEREAIIKVRQILIKELKDALNGKASQKFLNELVTDDIEWEDPLEKIKGHEEFVLLFKRLVPATFKEIDFTIYGEYHSNHEIIMDWSLKSTLKALPSYHLDIPMRTHLFLEPPSKKGELEKIFRIEEEWWGNPLLNERTTFSYLGKIHAQYRRFIGYGLIQILQKGWL